MKSTLSWLPSKLFGKIRLASFLLASFLITSLLLAPLLLASFWGDAVTSSVAGDIDALFVSERDKQPFFIRYGLPLTDAQFRALVLETQGLNGKALVLFVGQGGIKEAAVPIAELEDYRTGKKDEK